MGRSPGHRPNRERTAEEAGRVQRNPAWGGTEGRRAGPVFKRAPGPPAGVWSFLFDRALQRPDLDAAEGRLVAVVLEVDLALLHGAEFLPGVELALGDAAGPVVAAQFVRDYLLAVEPVLD